MWGRFESDVLSIKNKLFLIMNSWPWWCPTADKIVNRQAFDIKFFCVLFVSSLASHRSQYVDLLILFSYDFFPSWPSDSTRLNPCIRSFSLPLLLRSNRGNKNNTDGSFFCIQLNTHRKERGFIDLVMRIALVSICPKFFFLKKFCLRCERQKQHKQH